MMSYNTQHQAQWTASAIWADLNVEFVPEVTGGDANIYMLTRHILASKQLLEPLD